MRGSRGLRDVSAQARRLLTRRGVRFVELEEARAASGLRVVIATNVPSPWSQAALGAFDMKGLDYLAVRFRRSDEEIKRWTGARNAPAVLFDDEPPRTGGRRSSRSAERLGGGCRSCPRTASAARGCSASRTRSSARAARLERAAPAHARELRHRRARGLAEAGRGVPGAALRLRARARGDGARPRIARCASSTRARREPRARPRLLARPGADGARHSRGRRPRRRSGRCPRPVPDAGARPARVRDARSGSEGGRVAGAAASTGRSCSAATSCCRSAADRPRPTSASVASAPADDDAGSRRAAEGREAGVALAEPREVAGGEADGVVLDVTTAPAASARRLSSADRELERRQDREARRIPGDAQGGAEGLAQRCRPRAGWATARG